MEKKTLEERTAATLLQEPTAVTINGKEYQVPAPTLGTLLKVSAHISKLGAVQELGEDADPLEVLKEALSHAKDAKRIAYILTTLILGQKEMERKPTLAEILTFSTPRKRSERLWLKIIETLSPSEALTIVTRLIGSLQLGDFFALTTFLAGLNVAKQTKESGKDETKATARGQS